MNLSCGVSGGQQDHRPILLMVGRYNYRLFDLTLDGVSETVQPQVVLFD